MFSNPLIQRYSYSVLRRRQVWILGTMYVSVIILMFLINSAIYEAQEFYSDVGEMYESMFYQFILFQVLILWVFAPFNAASAIPNEIFENSYDFFRMLPVPAGQKTLGILVGKNLAMLGAAVFNFAILLFCGAAGGIDWTLQGQFFLLIICASVLLSSVSLLSSLNSTKKKKSSNIVILILVGLFLLPMLINGVVYAAEREHLESLCVSFYNIEIPLLLLISLLSIYFSVWAVIGTIRKFTLERESLFSRVGAFVFILGYYFIILGMYFEFLPDGDSTVCYTYWLVSLLPVVVVPVGSVRTCDKYLEHTRAMQEKHKGGGSMLGRLFIYSNLYLELCVFGIWAISAIWVGLFVGWQFWFSMRLIFAFLLFYLFLSLLLELSVVYNSGAGKIGYLLGFIAGLYFILPLISAGIFEAEELILYSPIGFLIGCFGIIEGELSMGWTVLGMNLLLCVIPVILVFGRYKLILEARRKM